MKSQLLILLRILCMQWITPPWWSQILPLSLSFNNLFTMCLGGSLSLSHWSLLIVFDVQIVFHEIWGVLGHYVFTYSILSLLSFCDSNCMHVCMSDGISWVSAHFYSFILLRIYLPMGYGFDSLVGKISWRRKWQPTPIFLPGKPHRQVSLVGGSPWVTA